MQDEDHDNDNIDEEEEDYDDDPEESEADAKERDDDYKWDATDKLEEESCGYVDVDQLDVVLDFIASFRFQLCLQCSRPPPCPRTMARRRRKPNEHTLKCDTGSHLTIMSRETEFAKLYQKKRFPDFVAYETVKRTYRIMDDGDVNDDSQEDPILNIPLHDYNIHRFMVWDLTEVDQLGPSRRDILQNPRTLEQVRCEQPRLYITIVHQLATSDPHLLRHVTLYRSKYLRRLLDHCGHEWHYYMKRRFPYLCPGASPFTLTSDPFDKVVRDLQLRRRDYHNRAILWGVSP